jgi:hypothetical protein
MSSHQRRLKIVAADDNKKRRNKTEKNSTLISGDAKVAAKYVNSGDIMKLPLLMFNSGDFCVAANRKGKN